MIVHLRHKPTQVQGVIWDGTDAALEAMTSLGIEHRRDPASGELRILTLGGPVPALVGDVVILGVVGDGYPIKPDVAALSYEPIEAGAA